MPIIANGYLGMAKEDTFGVIKPPSLFIPVLSVEPSSDPQNYYPENIKSTRSKTAAIPMGLKHEVSMEMDAEPNSLGHWLYGALGSVQSSQPDAANNPTVYQHIFTTAQFLPSYTIEAFDSIMTRQIGGSKFNSLTLSVEAGDEGTMKAEGELLAQTITDKDAPSEPDYSDKTPFTFSQMTVTKDGQQNDDLKSMEIEISNNLKDDRFTLRNSRNVQELPEGLIEIKVSAEMYFESKQAYLDFLAGEKGSFTFTLEGALISDTFYESLEIDLPNVSYDSFEVSMGGAGDEVMASLEGMAIYDATAGYDIQATLTNTVASY